MDATRQQKCETFLKSQDDTRRPLIHHLNADTSWLLQLPQDGPRPYFNLLIDPWLTGSQTEFSSYFHDQSHTVEAAFQSIAEIESYLQAIEDRAVGLRGDTPRDNDNPSTLIDAVVCTFYGTDHVHESTLRQLHPSVPLFLPPQSLKRVRSWSYFATIVQLDHFVDDWRRTSKSPLPPWLGLGWLEQKHDLQTIHKGLVVSFDTGSGPEAVIYMAHGIAAEDLTFIPKVAPELKVLALLHGLLRLKVGFRWTGYTNDANLGAHNGLKLQRLFDAKYWLGTHDEVKQEAGFTSYLLHKVPLTMEDALKEERRREGSRFVQKPVNWHQVENGEGLLLA